MVDFGNMSGKEGVKEYYENLVREFFSDATTYVSPDNHQNYYEPAEKPNWVGYVTPELENRIKREQKRFNDEAVTYLQQGTQEEVERMLDEADYLTPDGFNAGMSKPKRKKKTGMTKE